MTKLICQINAPKWTDTNETKKYDGVYLYYTPTLPSDSTAFIQLWKATDSTSLIKQRYDEILKSIYPTENCIKTEIYGKVFSGCPKINVFNFSNNTINTSLIQVPGSGSPYPIGVQYDYNDGSSYVKITQQPVTVYKESQGLCFITGLVELPTLTPLADDLYFLSLAEFIHVFYYED